MKPWMWAIAAGAAVGGAYTLSPLTVLSVIVMVPVWRRWLKDIDGSERRWLIALVGAAIAIRLSAIAVLFLTADPAIPYAYFFGDEEFFNRKSTWLRNVAMGIPISTADFLYAFDRTGDNSYLRVLTYVQALAGLAPYGIHVMNATCYLIGALLMHRLARKSFGGVAALAGLAILLLLPSLAIWSVSALKEPLYFLLATLNIFFAVRALRSSTGLERVLWIAVVIAVAFALQSLREGGLALTIAGMIGGVALALLVQRPKLLIGTMVAAPLAIMLAFTQPEVQERAWTFMHDAALKHWGHINTPGLTYKLMPPPFYEDRKAALQMTAADAARYSIRAVWSYLTVPLPWQIESRSALAFLPEQMIWYVIVLLLPIGFIAGLSRDPWLTGLLAAHGVALALIVAVSGGNVGTLVRHRGLALPYFVWLAGLGAVEIAHRLMNRSTNSLSLQGQVPHAAR